tara:strand:- start:153 stop:284 length:132 start_codon:yes stop_codon:yes gene_type:complete
MEELEILSDKDQQAPDDNKTWTAWEYTEEEDQYTGEEWGTATF